MRNALLAACALLLVSCKSSEDKTPEPDQPSPASVTGELSEIASMEDLRDGGPALTRFLRHESPVVRRRAATAVGRVGAETDVPALVDALGDSDAKVAEEALWALGIIGKRDAYDAIAILGKSAEPGLRAAVVEAVGRLGDTAYLGFVASFAGDASERVRSEVPAAVMRLREAAKTEEQLTAVRDAAGRIRSLLKDPSNDVRMRTAYAMCRVDASLAHDELVHAASASDPVVRAFAIRALAKVAAAGPEHFVTASKDPDPRVAYEALAGLATRSGEGVVAALEESAREGEATKVARALELLAEKGAAAPATVRPALKHRSPTVRAAAVAAMTAMRGADALGDVTAFASDPHILVVQAAARALVKIGGDGARAALASLASRGARAQAAVLDAYASAKLKDRRLEVDVFLREGLKSPDLAVCGTAVMMLEGRTEADWEKPLEEAFRSHGGREMYEIREMILAQLEAMKLGAAVAEEGLRDAQASVRIQAAKTLKACGREVAEPDPGSRYIKRVEVKRFVHDPVVLIETNRGAIRIRLFQDVAPGHVTTFVRLVKERFYDGKTWHRVVPDFVIQGGDPRGDGWGDGGFTLRDELSRERFTEGTVGMAKAGKDTGSCQLFITHVPTPHLDGRYTIFGRVIEGMEVVRAIEVGDSIARMRVESE
jgi:cyclophilin family peptidyl-prolyl cis-trans isomerase/HEAT repeat protein